MAQQESILDKVKKLVDKAASTDSMSEKENAMFLAQKLLQKHNLDMQDVETHVSKTDSGDTMTEISLPYVDEWEKDLVREVTQGNLGFFINDPWKAKKYAIVIGKSCNVNVIVYLINFFKTALQQSSITSYQESIQDKKKALADIGIQFDSIRSKNRELFQNTFMKDYFDGAVIGVRLRFQKTIAEAEKETPKFTDLIVYNDKAIQKYVKEKHGKLKNGKKGSKKNPNGEGFVKGRSDAENMNVYHGVDSGTGKTKVTRQIG